ncbi:MAG: glycosyltransferase [Roseiarcus sp.]
MRAPKVSVLMPAYNHVNFVGEAISSVLDQDFIDFEFLVSDDGSSDGTPDVARSFHDDRLSVFVHRVNRGAAVVHNELIQRATGKYVAVINSDDAWSRDKLSVQVAFLEANPDVAACFGRVCFIGLDGATIEKKDLWFGKVFDAENRSRGAWLRQFFTKSNCICHPTILIRRDVYLGLGPYDTRLRQLPDFEMWIRLVKKHSFVILDHEMIRFRIVHGANASADTVANNIRTMNEQYLIARRFFDGVSRDLLIEGFRDLMHDPNVSSDEQMEIEKSLLFLYPNKAFGGIYRLIGMTMLNELLASPSHREIMVANYSFDEHALNRLAGEVDCFSSRSAIAPPRTLRDTPARHLPRELGRFLRLHAKRIGRALLTS